MKDQQKTKKMSYMDSMCSTLAQCLKEYNQIGIHGTFMIVDSGTLQLNEFQS